MESSARYRPGLWAIAILVILNFGTLGFLWYGQLHRPEPPPREGGKADPGEFLISEVGFDAEQARTVRSLREEHFRETDPIKIEINGLKRQLMDELFDPSADPAKVQALLAAIGDKHAEFERGVFDHFQKIKQICRSDQQEKLKRVVLEALDRPKGAPPPEDQSRDRRRRSDDNRPPPPEGRRQPPPDHDRPRSPDSARPGR